MHFRILKTIATSGSLTALESTKSIFFRGSALDPAGGAYSYSAPPDPGPILLREGGEGKRRKVEGREGRERERKGMGRKGEGEEGKERMPP